MFKTRLLALLIPGILLTGCQQVSLLNFTNYFGANTAPIGEVIVVWKPTEGIGLDGLPTRGFSGQLLFFSVDRRFPEPVSINGDLRIYIFDNLGTAEEQAKPIHVFEFEQKAVEQLAADTTLGKSYQIFLPYTRKTMQEATCSLRVQLTPEIGLPVYSKMASVVLPGSSKSKPTGQSTDVVQAGFESVAWNPQTRKELPKFETHRLNSPIASKTVPLAEIQKQSLKDALAKAIESPTQESSRVPKRLPSHEAHPIEASKPGNAGSINGPQSESVQPQHPLADF